MPKHDSKRDSRQDRGAAPIPQLPTITADEVRGLRERGQLARVEVYPIPDVQSPDSPSVLLHELPPGLDLSFPAATVLPPKNNFRFVIDKSEPVVVTSAGVIGRAPDGAGQLIPVADPGRSLSRSHLGFERDARGRLLVFDLGSANGTEIVPLVGERIECVAHRRYPVAAGDVVLIGNYSVAIERWV